MNSATSKNYWRINSSHNFDWALCSYIYDLRDFRPHVTMLNEIGRKDLANQIAQDYLNTYVQGLNQFVQEITRIAVAQPRRLLNKGK